MKVVICGATSTIAGEVARIYATRNAEILLVGRNLSKLESMVSDLRIRGAKNVHIYCMDLMDATKIPALVDEVQERLGFIDLLFVAQGDLGDQFTDQKDLSRLVRVLENNYISPSLVLTAFAPVFESQRAGVIAAITSVAADRGRQSNYHYGSAKAGLSIFLSGLRNRMHPFHVQVTEFKLGFVDTAMTIQFKKGVLWSQPGKVAHKIVKAIQKKKSIVYLPCFWRMIMFVIRNVPESIFKRLKL